jgi:hypothetical protein
MIRGESLGDGGAKHDGWKIGLLAVVLRTPDELDDFCTQAKASHNAMAIKPTSASDIKYAVMSAPGELSK